VRKFVPIGRKEFQWRPCLAETTVPHSFVRVGVWSFRGVYGLNVDVEFITNESTVDRSVPIVTCLPLSNSRHELKMGPEVGEAPRIKMQVGGIRTVGINTPKMNKRSKSKVRAGRGPGGVKIVTGSSRTIEV
jgi:hypothetical protein